MTLVLLYKDKVHLTKVAQATDKMAAMREHLKYLWSAIEFVIYGERMADIKMYENPCNRLVRTRVIFYREINLSYI